MGSAELILLNMPGQVKFEAYSPSVHYGTTNIRMTQTKHVTDLVRCHHYQIIVPIAITQRPLLLHVKMGLASSREKCCDFSIFELIAYFVNKLTMGKFTTRAVKGACIATLVFLLPETNVQVSHGSAMASVTALTTAKFIEIETRYRGPNAYVKKYD